MDDTMKSCREFIAVLASSAPAPGGGGAAALAAALRERFGRRVLGPTAPPVDRVRGEYLATLLLKVEAGASLARAREAVRGILDRVVKSPECKGVTILCDVDPQ